ncbi:hypothetical protein TIFTF001_038866 [Ficus carica]|uniref:Uncharacterized protein n=1 Tax=Ficus carica TaxID=3494 RepID=A0AA88EBA6_FICCA|nr:hypothetical protein TIFTF001_034579 [Ficus carica]GMN69820.1 hypothetical protein TIFTF001_038866 [Ficus carica]
MVMAEQRRHAIGIAIGVALMPCDRSHRGLKFKSLKTNCQVKPYYKSSYVLLLVQMHSKTLND